MEEDPRLLQLQLFRHIDQSLVDIKERLVRIEAQDYSARLAELKLSLKELDVDVRLLKDNVSTKIQDIELEQQTLKTKITPLIAVLSMVAAAVISLIVSGVF